MKALLLLVLSLFSVTASGLEPIELVGRATASEINKPKAHPRSTTFCGWVNEELVGASNDRDAGVKVGDSLSSPSYPYPRLGAHLTALAYESTISGDELFAEMEDLCTTDLVAFADSLDSRLRNEIIDASPLCLNLGDEARFVYEGRQNGMIREQWEDTLTLIESGNLRSRWLYREVVDLVYLSDDAKHVVANDVVRSCEIMLFGAR